MLIDLKSFENLGTPAYFFELFTTISKSTSVWKIEDVELLFYNKIIDGKTIFDGCYTLAVRTNSLIVDSKGKISVNPVLISFLNSERQMCDKFIELLLLSLKEDDDFHNIFSSKNLSYDIVYRTVQINNSAFALRFANLKQLFLDFDIIRVHPTKEIKKYIFNSRYKKLFDKAILPEIRKRKIGIEELKKGLEQNQIYGEEAELFVLEYEKRRLNNKEGIEWVAEYSVAEGYDISSFDNEDSIFNDRFIEVKSYSQKPYFFWSRNEIDISRIKSETYYLYLVNRDEMNRSDYNPLIIRNPFNAVLENPKWIKEVEKFRIELDT